jgi:hypothetical protein
MPAELKSTSQGRTMVLTISNPDHRNALGPEIYAAGVEALNAADSSPDVRSVVITGAGSTFCAGGNLQRLLENRGKPREVQAAVDRGPAWLDRGDPQLSQAGDRGGRRRGGRRRLLAGAGLRLHRRRRQRLVRDGLQQRRPVARRRRHLEPGPRPCRASW